MSDPAAFRAAYTASGLRLDACSSSPIPLLVFATLHAALPSNNNTLAVSVYSVLRLAGLLQLSRAGQRFRQLIAAGETFLQRRVGANTVRVFETLCLVGYFGHIMGCLFCLFGARDIASGPPQSAPVAAHYASFVGDGYGGMRAGASSWVQLNGLGDMTPFQIYLRGTYWAFYTIVTVGYGNIRLASNNERLFAMLTMTAGAIICDAGVAAILSSIIGSADRLSGSILRHQQCLIRFCATNNLDAGGALGAIVGYNQVNLHPNPNPDPYPDPDPDPDPDPNPDPDAGPDTSPNIPLYPLPYLRPPPVLPNNPPPPLVPDR